MKYVSFFRPEGSSHDELWSTCLFESPLLNVTLRDYCKSHDSGGWALDAWERRLVRGLKQVKTAYHLREHRLFLWPEKANGTEASSEESQRLQPEINAYRQQFVNTFLDGTVQYLRQHSRRVAACVRDDESGALFEDDMMEDIRLRLTCQEHPQHRMGGTQIGAGGPHFPMGGTQRVRIGGTRIAAGWELGLAGPDGWQGGDAQIGRPDG